MECNGRALRWRSLLSPLFFSLFSSFLSRCFFLQFLLPTLFCLRLTVSRRILQFYRHDFLPLLSTFTMFSCRERNVMSFISLEKGSSSVSYYFTILCNFNRRRIFNIPYVSIKTFSNGRLFSFLKNYQIQSGKLAAV